MRKKKIAIEKNKCLEELERLRDELEISIREMKNKIKLREEEDLIERLGEKIQDENKCIICGHVLEEKIAVEETGRLSLLRCELNKKIQKYEEVQERIIMENK